jgi:hypothetical protein
MTTKPVPAGCGQNRWPERRANPPQAAEAASEPLEDDEAIERRFRATARFWTLYAAVLLVAVCAGIAHFLPVLQKLASN